MNTFASIQTLFHSAFFIPFICSICFPATFSGTVVDKENADKPIPGVLVSGGHTTHRTYTDAQGHFTIDAPQTSILTGNSRRRASSFVQWDRQKRFMDFSQAPSIKAFWIFSLNGTRLFSIDIQITDRLVRIPALAHGVFLIKALFSDNTFYSWKWIALNARGIFNVPLPSNPALRKTAVDGGETMLLFRHDDYFPFDRKLGSPAQDLVISMKPDPRRFVFDQTKIHSYSFMISHEDSLSMEKNAFDEQFVPADLTFDSVSFGKVGLRFKGSKYYLLRDCFDSLGRVMSSPLCAKVSMKVKFDKYNDSARFFCMKRINLHAMADDQSKMREMLCYRLFRDMGIYASKTAYVKLYINGSFWGLFLAVEELDGRFTKSRWPSFGDGNLFKEAWPDRANTQYYIDALQTNDHPEDKASGWRMVNFTKAVLGSTKETFVQNISPFMDLDYWLRYIAVDRAIHNADGIMTWYCGQDKSWAGNHNFYFYEEENPGGKLWILPWDLPATLTKTDMIIDDYDVPEWNVAPKNCDPIPVWGGSFAIPPHCDKLIGLTAETLWDGFVSIGEQLLADCFKADRMKQKIDTFATLIEPVVAQDPTLDMKRWQGEIKDLRVTMDILSKGFDDYIHNRVPILDTAGFNAPFPDSGFLLTDRVNNFEFTPVAPIASWSQTDASSGSLISLALDTVAPLWGKSDLLCSVVFTPLDTPVAYAEWSAISLFCQKAVDCKSLKRIRMHLKCDALRHVDVYLLSKYYEQKGAKNQYGWWSFATNPANKQYIFDMTQIDYPTWGDADNPDIRDTVLTSIQGIGIKVEPRFNNQGKLAIVPDSGYMRIDNIIFE